MSTSATKLFITLLTLATAFLHRQNEAEAASTIKHVVVIVMENKDFSEIYGNQARAPYINTSLLPKFAHATGFEDELPGLESEPHYLWMEAGTNKFADHTFKTDD